MAGVYHIFLRLQSGIDSSKVKNSLPLPFIPYRQGRGKGTSDKVIKVESDKESFA
jgi:hypothetical protein